MTISINIDIDPDRLSSYSNQFLAAAWHCSQINPAPIEDKAAGEVADRIGSEIIRRWLAGQAPELYRHNSSHHYWHLLATHGKWNQSGDWNPGEPAIPAAAKEGA